MTIPRTAASAVLTLALATAAWFVAVRHMQAMDMGAGVWVSMMAAMMLPGAVPAVVRRARVEERMTAVPLFAGSYLAVWTLVAVAAYVAYRPPGSAVAGALIVAAGIYELTPLKRDCRRRCRENVRSGFRFGLYCVGSSIGLMAMLIALGVMSVAWMSVVAVLVFAQKLLPLQKSVDVALALAIVGLGVLTATT